MTIVFEELDYQETPLGAISLRRRSDPKLDGKILYEVLLGEEYLMSSLFPDAEIELSKLALASLNAEKNKLDIVVGGLGLGYTAVAALESATVKSLMVIDVMEPVINWHQQGLVPLGEELTNDPRTTLVHADFFASATTGSCGFYPDEPTKLVHAVLLDIDHSPRHWLNEENGHFYTKDSLSKMSEKIHDGGLFGLWSNDPPDVEFIALLEKMFAKVESHVVTFPSPYKDGDSTNTVYLAYKKS